MTGDPVVRRTHRHIGSRKSGWIRGRENDRPVVRVGSRDPAEPGRDDASPAEPRQTRKRRRPTRLRFAIAVVVLVLYVLTLRAADLGLFADPDALFVFALLLCGINFAIFTHDRASVRWVGRMLFAIIPAVFVLYVMGAHQDVAV